MLSVLYAEIQIRAYILVRPLLLNVAFAIVTVYLMDRRSRIDKLAPPLCANCGDAPGEEFWPHGRVARGGLNAPFFMGDRNDFAWAMLVMIRSSRCCSSANAADDAR